MKTRLILRSGLLAAVILSAAWIVFSAYMISETLFPNQQILITAYNGAEVKVENGILHVLNGSAGMTHFNPVLMLALAIPFTIILAAAVAGCITISRKPINASSLQVA